MQPPPHVSLSHTVILINGVNVDAFVSTSTTRQTAFKAQHSLASFVMSCLRTRIQTAFLRRSWRSFRKRRNSRLAWSRMKKRIGG